MNTKQREAYLKTNWLSQSTKELCDAIGIKETRLRIIARKLGLPRKLGGTGKDKSKEFIHFLSKARTEKEIKAKFPNELLEKTYSGLRLFKQRNHYNELMYILLPIMTDEKVKVLPKDWKYHLGKSEEGIMQPYILCELPNFKGKLKIALLFDVHFGHSAHKHDKFLKYLQWIKNTPGVYAVIGGDLLENALDDGRGMTYDQTENPQTQFDMMVKFLAPIAHKILIAVPGNHEERTSKKTGFDIMKALADRLDIPYFSGPVWCSIIANGYKWNLFVQHGRGNSQTKGGKMNMANRPKKFTGLIHFFVSGHVHDAVCENETVITDDPINCRLVYMEQWTIIAPAFLGWEDTYAYRAGYPPPARGGVAIELDANGDYRGSLT